jgi:hypothetical protein
MSSNVLEKFHDPVVQRKIFVSRIVAFVVDFLKPYQLLGIQSEEQLKRLQNTIELDVFKYGTSTNFWTKRELPLQVKLAYHKGKMHMDLNGPLAGEVYVEMQNYLNFSQSIGELNEGYVDDDDDYDDEEESEEQESSTFRYGRR